MNWLINMLGSSVGKKLLMAVTGMGFCFFLAVHLGGNLTIYGGKVFFNAYVEHLHALGPLIIVAEACLLLLGLVHVGTALTLFYQNSMSRPHRYISNKWAGGRSIGSATMPYTGLMMLVFIIIHLLNLHFVDPGQSVYDLLTGVFEHPGYIFLYSLTAAVAALHISHGFWSVFQSLGANHPQYMPLMQAGGLSFSLIIGLGFGFLPIYMAFF